MPERVATTEQQTPDRLNLLAAGLATAVVTACRFWLHLTNPTIAALSYLLIVLVTAARSSLAASLAVSILADLCLNYFFIPPIGTFAIDGAQNLVALLVFLAVATIASNLSTAARSRAAEVLSRQAALGRLFDLSRDILLITESVGAMRQLVACVSQRFELEFAAICLPGARDWQVSTAGANAIALDAAQLSAVFAEVSPAGSAQPKTTPERRTIAVDGRPLTLAPLLLGHKAIGLLALAGPAIEPRTLDALTAVVAIAVERAQFLEERKEAELARQSEELKSALLASLGHDLRTPLTAIRVAASNLQASWLRNEDRREQSDLILAEVARLNRLFQNILDMARLDAGDIARDVRWVHPAEIYEAAYDHVVHALRGRPVDLQAETEQLVRLDPRLTASALAHLLENAAQYSPSDRPITVTMAVSADSLQVTVRDRGAGISPADLPRLFDRFYRGIAARRRPSGTGMGLSIARGMLAAGGGRLAVENCPDGGARFTMVVPAETRMAEPNPVS
jgi:two-component system sensor histidine kinase KdpD